MMREKSPQSIIITDVDAELNLVLRNILVIGKNTNSFYVVIFMPYNTISKLLIN